MMINATRILVLGSSGMLGNAFLRLLGTDPAYKVFGSVRTMNSVDRIQARIPSVQFISGIDVENFDSLTRAFAVARPDVVINCIGIVKQLSEADDALISLPVNSLLPHRLAQLCEVAGARLIHMSTDCVFSGERGGYTESDVPDAYDLYGRSKLLGEVEYENTITLRTSIIGHELQGSRSLIDWFLSQKGSVRGYKRAIFSGFPTIEIARIVRDFILRSADLHGLYHLSAEPIDKFQLLSLVSRVYGKDVVIEPDESVVIDRSLNSDRFRAATGFRPEPWECLIERMYEYRW